MLDYPPRIVAAEFTDPPVVVADDSVVDELEGARSTTAEAVTNPRDRPHYGVVELKLTSRLKTDFSSVSYGDRGHADVPSGGARFHFLPSAETVDIRWKVKGADVITSARLQLFIRGKAEPVWERAIDRSALVDTSQPLSEEDTRRKLRKGVLAWDGTAPTAEQGGAATFPDQLVTAEHVLYKLRMVVSGPSNGKCVGAEAWTYFDVLVDRIEPRWGDDAHVPDRVDVAAPHRTRVRDAEKDILSKLKQEVVLQGRFDVDQKVALDVNTYRAGGEPTARRYDRLKELWGDGPRLPIIAKVHLKRSDGSTTADAAAALGGATFLWDWSDPRCDNSADPASNHSDLWTSAGCEAPTRTYLASKFDETRGRYAPKSFNCPDVYGGKHGPACPTPFLPMAGDPRPFGFERCRERKWCALTRVDRTRNPAETGLLFQPSRFAGDCYRVTVYLLPTPAEFAATDWTAERSALQQDAQAAGRVFAASGRIEVRHTLKVTVYRVNSVDFTKATVEDVYDRQAGCTLDVQKTPLVELNDYLDPAVDRNAADELLARELQNAWLAPLRLYAVDRSPSGCAIAYHDWSTYLGIIDGLYANQPMHAVRVDPAALEKISAEGLRSTTDTDAWRGVVVHKLPESSEVLILTLEGAWPPGGGQVRGVISQQVFAVEAARSIPATDALRNTARQAGPGRGASPTSSSEYDNILPRRSAWGEFGKPFVAKRFTAYADKNRADRQAVVYLFDKVRSTDTFPSGSAFNEVCTSSRGIVMASAPTLSPTDRAKFKNTEAVISHELGHVLFFDHAYSTLGGQDAPPLVPEQHLCGAPCIMNYDPAANHFCGLCVLRLRGWNVRNEVRIDLPDGAVLVAPGASVGAAKRIRVLLSSRGGDADAVFTCDSDKLDFYAADVGGAALNVNNRRYTGAELSRGVTLYAQANQKSGAPHDIALKLTPTDTRLAGEERKLTAVALRLDAYLYRKDAATQPRALRNDEKESPGVFVQKQNAGRHSRVRVVVRRTDPEIADKDVSLLVRPVDNRLTLLTAADARQGRSGARAWSSQSDLIPPDGVELFVEGASASAALRDTGIELRIGEQVGDRLRATVVDFTGMTVSIPATPVKTDRSAAGIAPARNPNTFQVQPTWGDDFQPGETLVLVANSLDYSPRLDQRAVLTANVNPPVGAAPNNLPLRWNVTRRTGAEKDSKDVVKLSANETPTIYVQAGNQAKLSADAVGSFHVQAVVDPYGDGKTGEGGERPPSISLNLVLVHVRTESVDCAPGSRYLRDAIGTTGQVTLHAGAFNHTDKRLRGVNLSAKIVAVGGGPRGRLGVNKLLCGWVQNIVACRSNAGRSVRIATYHDLATNTNHNVEKIFVTGAANRDYLPSDAAPQIAAFPILDGNLLRQNHNNHAPTTLSTNLMASRDKSVGVELTVTANDSPNEAVETIKLPGRPTRVLKSIDWELCFSAFLCCWSLDAVHALGVLNQTDWEIRQRWQVNWPTPPVLNLGKAQLQGKPTLTAGAPPVLNVSVQARSELTPASRTRLEIGQPSVHHAQADDCRA